MTNPMRITGAGGGTKKGEDAANTLRSKAHTRFVEIISEGEIVGLVDGAKSIYFGETPLQNADGSYNFNNVNWTQHVGLADEGHFLGHLGVETPTTVETQVKKTLGPVTREINAPNADAARLIMRIPSLVKRDAKSGQLLTTNLTYRIQVQPFNGVFTTVITNEIKNEKTTAATQIAHRITLPAGGNPWNVRVIRDTDDSADVNLQNDLFWESLITIVDGKFIYPNSAGFGMEVNAEDMGGKLDQRAYRVKGIKSLVPMNYDPLTRVFATSGAGTSGGVWNGQFKTAWHNDPVWVFYDLVINNRYGLGEFVSEAALDKWSLYAISQYGNQFISSGYKDSLGVDILEPRYTWNGVINKREEAFAVLRQIANAWRGMSYWSMNAIFGTADMPQDPLKIVAPANTIDGQFNYSRTALKARHSVIIVKWNDPADFYRSATEVVVNDAMVAKFGWREKTVVLNGCTSRGLAHRYGRWILDIEEHETETIEYRASFDQLDIRPGNIIAVADPKKAAVRLGGRIVSHVGNTVTFDAPFTPAGGASYSLMLVMPDGTLVTRAISSFPTSTTATVAAFPQTAQADAMFAITGTDVQPRQYRVLAMEESEPNVAKITALFHDPLKYGRVEQNLKFDPIPYTRPQKISTPPTNINFVETSFTKDGKTEARLNISWSPPIEVMPTGYLVIVRTPTQGVIKVDKHTKSSFDIENVEAGTYTVSISTIALGNIYSVPAEATYGASGPVAIPLHTISEFKLSNEATLDSNIFTGADALVTWKNNFASASGSGAGGVAQNNDVSPLYSHNEIKVYDAELGKLLRTERVQGQRYSYRYEDNLKDSAALNLSTILSTDFSTLDSWTGTLATLTVANGIMTATANGAPRLVRSMNYAGAGATKIRIRMRKISGDGNWFGRMYYATPGHVVTSGFYKVVPAPADPFAWNVLEWDMAALTAGGADYVNSTITQLRLDFVNGGTGNDIWEFDWIQVGAQGVSVDTAIPTRALRFDNVAYDVLGRASATATKTVSNPLPAAIDPTLQVDGTRILLSYPAPTDLDYRGIIVWRSTTNNFNPLTTTPYYEGDARPLVVPCAASTPYYFRIAAYDSFGKTGLNISSQVSATSGFEFALDSTPPAKPATPVLTSTSAINAIGDLVVTLKIDWAANGEGDLAGYELEVKEGTGSYIGFGVGNITHWERSVPPATAFTARIKAYDKAGNKSIYSDVSTSHTTVGDTTVPATVTGATVVPLFRSLWVLWTPIADKDLDYYEIFVHTAATPAPTAGSTTTLRSKTADYVLSDLGSGVQRFFWIRAVDKSGNKSVAWSSAANGTTTKIVATDIPADMITLAMIGSDLAVLGRGASLPAAPFDANTPEEFYNTTNGLFYVRNSTNDGWTQRGDASLIVGTLQAGQIGAGVVGTVHLDAKSVTASKMWIGDTTNMFPDPDFLDLKALTLVGGIETNYTLVATAADAGGSKQQLQITATEGAASSLPIPVEAARWYYASIWMERSGTASPFARTNVDWFSDRDGLVPLAAPDNTTIIGATASTVPARSSLKLLAPIGAKSARMRFWRTTVAGSFTCFSEPIFLRANDGVLTIDGTVKAQHVETNFFSAYQVLVGQAYIESAYIVEVNANIIKAGTTISDTIIVGGGGTTTLGNTKTATVNFNARNDRVATTPANPVIPADGTAVDHTLNTDGSIDLSLEWTFTNGTGANDIDGFYVFVRSSTSNVAYTIGTTKAEEQVYTLPADKRALILQGLPANLFYTFGVQAYRAVDPDIDATGFKKSAIVQPTWAGTGPEAPYQPATTVAFAGNITGTINGTSAATIVTGAGNGTTALGKFSGAGSTLPAGQVEFFFATSTSKGGNATNTDNVGASSSGVVSTATLNFNNRNDRMSTVPATPTIVATGTAIDHTNNADGSVNISFEWVFSGTGDAANIDGFIVFLRQSTSSAAYTIGTTPAEEQVFYVTPEKRAAFFYGMAAEQYYTFGVQAYRIVDTDVTGAVNGALKSAAIAQPGLAAEAPYRPITADATSGNITATVGGVAAATLVSNASNGNNAWSKFSGAGQTLPSGAVEFTFAGSATKGGAASDTANVNGVSAATISGAVANFNANNDRNGTTPTTPGMLIDGTAVDHALNVDGSADISLEWTYTTSATPGAANNIDGFQIYIRSSTSASPYTMGTTPAEETIFVVPADQRSFIFKGLPASLYHTFGVQAYRAVDTDVNATGQIKSLMRQPSATGEAPYQPATTVAFTGNVTGTVNGTGADVVALATGYFNANNDRNSTIPTAPTILADGTSLDHILNTDGSAWLSFEWDYTVSNVWNAANNIDGFIVLVRQSTSSAPWTPVGNNANETTYFVPRDARSFTLPSCAADLYFTFAVSAYRTVDTDISSTGILKSGFVKPAGAGEDPYRPSATVAFDGDITGTINSTSASTVATAAINFNANNDRIATVPANPVIAVDGTAVDHTVNVDGSVNISFEWGFTNGTGANNIDGFIVFVRQSISATAYTMGTTPAEEQVFYVTPEKRAMFLMGVAADQYFTFGIKAYRIVDSDVVGAVNGALLSAMVQPTRTTAPSEHPYRPATEVAYTGKIGDTVNGRLAVDVAAASVNFDSRNDRKTAVPNTPTVANNGNCLAHSNNADGSVNIVFNWGFVATGDAGDIDGFNIFVRSSTSSAAYVMGTTVAEEQVFQVPADKRAASLYAVAADRYYTFGVQAYRVVDADIDATGLKKSPITQPIWTGTDPENPYRPETSTSFTGTVNGTVAGTATIGTTLASTVETRANDPATRVNAHTVLINPGKILLTGSTALSSWLHGADQTLIAGGKLGANTVSANKMEIGARGISVEGLEFSYDKATGIVSWSAGVIRYTRDDSTLNGDPDGYVNVLAGTATWTTGTLFIFWNKGSTDPANGTNVTLATTFQAATANAMNTLVLANYRGGIVFVTNYGRTIIDGGEIKADSIEGDRVKANTLEGSHMKTDTLEARHLRVTDSNNLVPDNQLTSTANWTGLGTNWTLEGNISDSIKSPNRFRFTPTTGTGYIVGPISLGFPVMAGQEYYFEMRGLRSTGTKFNLLSRVSFYDQAGAVVGSIDFAETDHTSNAVLVNSGAVVAPVNAKTAKLYCYTNRTYTDGQFVVGDYTCRLKFGGNLVIDGDLEGRHFKADTIEAGHMKITAGDNLVPDDQMIGTTAWTLTTELSFVPETTDMGSVNSVLYTHTGGTGYTTGSFSKAFPVVPGEKLYAAFEFRALVVSTNVDAWVRVAWYDAAGAAITPNYTTVWTGVLTGTGITSKSLELNPPTGAKSARVYLYVNRATSTGSGRFGGFKVKTKADGNLIVDNAIEAKKLLIGQRGIEVVGMRFEGNRLSGAVGTATATVNRLAWEAGTIVYTNDAGAKTTAPISAGNSILWTTGFLYIYWIKGGTVLNSTATAATAYADDNVVLGTYAGGTAWVSTYGRTVIDGQNVTAASFTGDKMQVDSITTRELKLFDFTNLVSNPSLATTSDGWVFGTSVTRYTTGAPAGGPTTTGMKLEALTALDRAGYWTDVEVAPGDEFFLSALAARSIGSNQLYWSVQFYNAAGAAIGGAANTGVINPANNVWTLCEGRVTAPALTVKARFRIYADSLSATVSGTWWVTKFTVQKATNTRHLVDNAVSQLVVDNTADILMDPSAGYYSADTYATCISKTITPRTGGKIKIDYITLFGTNVNHASAYGRYTISLWKGATKIKQQVIDYDDGFMQDLHVCALTWVDETPTANVATTYYIKSQYIGTVGTGGSFAYLFAGTFSMLELVK